MPAPREIVELFERFHHNRSEYESAQYNETRLRREFVDPMFEALDWDVSNRRGYAGAYKDVIHEDFIRIEGSARSPDYSFRIGGARKFFVETKKPSVNLKDDPSPAFQLRRYAWSAKLPVSILTDFDEFAVYDTRIKPKPSDKASVGRIEYLRGEQILEDWDEKIAGHFSREAVLRGDFDKFAQPFAKRRGTTQVDEAFLEDIERWREALAKVLALRNQELTTRELNYAVQATIDRIVFLRICEDRGIEEHGQLKQLLDSTGIYQQLIKLFRGADDRYNSGLFHFRDEPSQLEEPDGLTPTLLIDDKTLREIVGSLYYPASPYEFSVLPADILGHVYERFLGKVIRLTAGHRAVVEEKPEVRKAGGVYYTPTFVVDHIIRSTLTDCFDGSNPKKVDHIRVLDPACGSGSFLLGAYQYILDWYRDWYIDDDPEKWARRKSPRLRAIVGNDWRLTAPERKRILLNHIFGVDVDPQAVEVTKLSLLLKVLEGETGAQLSLLHERALPDLGENVKCGNSLIEPDFLSSQQLNLLDEDAVLRVNAFDWKAEFPVVFKMGGFDAVIGNPPYVLLQDAFRDEAQLTYLRGKYGGAAFKVDTYHLFIERGMQLSAPGGRCSMITPSNFLTNNHLATLRRQILAGAAVEELLVVDGGVFDGISVDNAIFTLRVGAAPGETFTIDHVVPTANTLEVTSTTSVSISRALKDPHVLFTGSSDKGVEGLWDKVLGSSLLLGTIADVNFGKQLRDRRKFPRDVIEVASARDVPKGYRPCYTGRDIERYSVVWNGLACSNSERARSGGCWDSAKQDAAPKLLTRQIGRFPEFGIDTLGYQCLNTMFMVNVGRELDPRFVLGILNSSLIRALWIDRFYDQRRTFPKIKGTYLKQLPIYDLQSSNGSKRTAGAALISLVDQLLAVHKQNMSTRTATDKASLARRMAGLERSIDDQVFALYDLSDSEMTIVRDSQR